MCPSKLDNSLSEYRLARVTGQPFVDCSRGSGAVEVKLLEGEQSRLRDENAELRREVPCSEPLNDSHPDIYRGPRF